MTYIKHKLLAVNVRPDRKKVLVVREWLVPGTVRKRQSILALVNYFPRYIKDFSEIAAPFNEKTRAVSGRHALQLMQSSSNIVSVSRMHSQSCHCIHTPGLTSRSHSIPTRQRQRLNLVFFSGSPTALSCQLFFSRKLDVA